MLEEVTQTSAVESPTDAAENSPPENGRGGKKPSTLKQVLPSDRLVFPKQIGVLRAFAAVFESNGGSPVTNEAAGEVAKLAAGTLIVTNAFFSEVGFLTRKDDGFTVAGEVSAFLNAEESGLSPESAPEKLRPLLEAKWFWTTLAPRLRLGPMDTATFRKVVGEAAGATKEHIGRLDVLLEYLVFVGLVRREGDSIRYAGSSASPALQKPETPAAPLPAAAKTPAEPDECKGLEKHALTLDVKTGKKLIIYAPTTLTQKQLERVRSWLEFQFIIEDEGGATTQ